MTTLERAAAVVVGWFVRPAETPARSIARRLADEPLILTSGDRSALGLGAALALAAAPEGVAVLVCWQVPAAERRRAGLATARARRLAASLQARDVPATAAGRLVVASLPADATAAVLALRRVESACEVPCPILLGAARGDEWDEPLAERRVAILHGGDPGLVEVAAERLGQQGVEARLVIEAPGPIARSLAIAGWATPSSRALRAAVGLA
jgi:hypothetical protein